MIMMLSKVKNFLGFSTEVSQLPPKLGKLRPVGHEPSGLRVFEANQEEQVHVEGNVRLDHVYYLHLRWYDEDDLMPWGGATFAYRCIKEPNGHFVVNIGVSHCCRCDNFNKRIGRDIALARLLTSPSYIMHLLSLPTKQKIINYIKEEFYFEKSKYFPEVRKEYQ